MNSIETKITVAPTDALFERLEAINDGINTLINLLESQQPNNKEKFVHGLAGIAKLTGESISTISRKLQCGIYKNVSGCGKVVVRYDEIPVKAS